jgi:signal transduction histidine kinase/DNA-binding response OmpR family regulator/CHASE3 domain sensor protein
MQKKAKKNLTGGFGISLLILLVSSVASFISIRQFIKSSERVSHTHTVLQKVEEIISNTKDAETGQRGFLLTHDVNYLAPYNGTFEKVQSTFEEVDKLMSDDPEQKARLAKLKALIDQRYRFLKVSIDSVQANRPVDVNNMKLGQELMKQSREQVDEIKAVEEGLLAQRNKKADDFTRFTPIMIIIAAALAVLITLYYYRRLTSNFKEINKLNAELRIKDEQIAGRIGAIQRIAARISAGDFKSRATDEEKDELGSLSISLNKMAESLERSFSAIEGREWMQKGAADLSKNMVGEKQVNMLANDVIAFLAEYSGSSVGAFYLMEDGSTLVLKGGYALMQNYGMSVKKGEGIVGQCAMDGKAITIDNINDTDFNISFTAGELKPKCIHVFPIYFENRMVGIIEMGSRTTFTDLHKNFFKEAGESIGIAINTAYNRVRLQELLEETQAQTEELQTQHGELEGLNTELEAQAHKLQSSEEELKVQQEELMEANQELEERSRLLEEKNHLVVVRNLEIQRKAEELAQNAQYKSEFLANMSHELRTPLNSILLLSRLLSENKENNLDKEQVEYAKVIQSSGNGLLQLIDEILDLSRIESGKMQLDYEMISVNEVANDMNSLFGPMAKEKNVEFSIHVDPSMQGQIETDKLRLEQIIKNLISNSLKFTNKGFITLSIYTNAEENSMVDFSVKDSGIGIPVDKQELIFEAFQQADGSTHRKYGGTGLGLSISRQLSRLLGGDIRLVSQAGEGSEFIVTIPKSQKSLPAEKEEKPSATISKINEDKTNGVNHMELVDPYTSSVIPEEIPDDRNNIQRGDSLILIIEDDSVFAKTLLDFTRKKGYKGIVAVRGDQGIDLAKHYKPMGILLDIQLPVKSGWDVMDEIKKDPMTRHIPVHIVSSFEMKKESISKGAVDFVYKPLAYEKMDEVFRKIENVVKNDSKKVMIVEDNTKHAQALAYFLSTHNINSVISGNIKDSVSSLEKREVDCVILDMGIPDMKAYETLDTVKKNAGLETTPVLIFTGKSLSRADEIRLKQYADSIVLKTAHSYQRILDEVSLFLHLVEENTKSHKKPAGPVRGAGSLSEVLFNKKVLVADDDVRNIFSLTKTLEKHRMQVISAIDGKEALQMLESNPDTDIVLMDIMMPEMDGFEAIARIRQNPRLRNLPIIAVTAKAMAGDREKCIKAGASDYISKPVDIDQLVSLLRIWLYEK